MKKFFLPFLLLLGVSILLNACSSRVDQISLQVNVIKLEHKADGNFLATLQFSNPNVGSVNVEKSTHQLFLNGKPAGVLEITEPIGLPAQQSVTTTATFRLTGLPADFSGAVSYQLVSSMLLRVFDDTTERCKSSSSGTVTMP